MMDWKVDVWVEQFVFGWSAVVPVVCWFAASVAGSLILFAELFLLLS